MRASSPPVGTKASGYRASLGWDNCVTFRSTDYQPEGEELGGTVFVLMAFVTNANDDVTAGSDGVEHMQVKIYLFLKVFNLIQFGIFNTGKKRIFIILRRAVCP